MNKLPDPTCWQKKRVLVTGHSGFKGSWLVAWLETLGADVFGLSLPTPPSSPSLWGEAKKPSREIGADLSADGDWKDAVRNFSPEVVFHLAAQSLVGRGFENPTETFLTNIVGGATLLSTISACEELEAFVFITTDKVYDPRQKGPHSERDFLGGTDPYSASKAGADLMALSWPGVDFQVVTARCGNVIGGGDWSEQRLVPDIIRAWSEDRRLTVRRSNGVRPWLHVLESIRGYILYAEATLGHLEVSRSMNFGPRTEDAMTVVEIVQIAEIELGQNRNGRSLVWMNSENTQFPENPMLMLDSSQARDQLSWQSVLGTPEALKMTFEWYRLWLSGVPAQALIEKEIEVYKKRVGAA